MFCIIIIDCFGNVINQFLPAILSYYISEYLLYLPVVVTGFYLADKNGLSYIADKISEKWIDLWIFILFVLCFLARGLLKQIWYLNLDCIYAPTIIFTVWIFFKKHKSNCIRQVLKFLGTYSLEIWFLHAIFFIGNSTVQHVAYWPKLSILILVWVLLILSPIAIVERWCINKVLLAFSPKNISGSVEITKRR